MTKDNLDARHICTRIVTSPRILEFTYTRSTQNFSLLNTVKVVRVYYHNDPGVGSTQLQHKRLDICEEHVISIRFTPYLVYDIPYMTSTVSQWYVFSCIGP